MYPYGEKDNSGAIVSDPRTCVLTGQSVKAGDVRQKIKGTRLFYWVSAGAYHLLTDEKRAEIEAAIQSQASPKPAPRKRAVDTVESRENPE